MSVFTYSVVLYCRRTGNLYGAVHLLLYDSLGRYQANEDIIEVVDLSSGRVV